MVISVFWKEKQRKAATISAISHRFGRFAIIWCGRGVLMMDVSETLKAPRVEKKLPGVLSPEEVERLMDAVQGMSPKELRDKAMLELLYATGIRVSELIGPEAFGCKFKSCPFFLYGTKPPAIRFCLEIKRSSAGSVSAA